MTPTIAKIIWLVFMIGWVVLRQRPGQHSRRTAISYSGRDLRERLLMAASFTGLGIIPFVYVTTHFPRFADYPFMPVLAYLGVAVDVACFCLFLRTHHDLGKNWSVSLDLRERHTLVTSGVYGARAPSDVFGVLADGASPRPCCCPIGSRGCRVWSGLGRCSSAASDAKKR